MNLTNNENKKIDKIEKLVETIAVNVLKLTDKVDNLEKNTVEVKESNKEIRKDIFNLGDRFPSRFAFDELSNRVYKLEKKQK
jgi:archaellum component FlaC